LICVVFSQVSPDCGYSTVAIIERGADAAQKTAMIVNLFDTTSTTSDDGCRDIRIALVDPARMPAKHDDEERER